MHKFSSTSTISGPTDHSFKLPSRSKAAGNGVYCYQCTSYANGCGLRVNISANPPSDRCLSGCLVKQGYEDKNSKYACIST